MNFNFNINIVNIVFFPLNIYFSMNRFTSERITYEKLIFQLKTFN